MAGTFTLSLQIDPSAVGDLAGKGARIVLAKPGGATSPNVAWLAVAPRRSIRVEWSDTCGVYASDTEVVIGSPVVVRNKVYPAADRVVHRFALGGFRSFFPSAAIPPRHYDVRNAARAKMTFGLLQAATVNGRTYCSPLNAVVLPPRFTADFTPAAELFVWVQCNARTGRIIADIPHHATTINYGTTHELRYRYRAFGSVFVSDEVESAARSEWRQAEVDP